MSKSKTEKKIPQAVALKYDAMNDTAPVLTAKGKGLIAEKIIELAKKQGVPIKEDPILVDMLSKLDIDDRIPTDLYKAVAEIFAFIYSLNEKKRKENISSL